MNEKIMKLENLFEEITDVQEEIKTKTALRNEYIILIIIYAFGNHFSVLHNNV